MSNYDQIVSFGKDNVEALVQSGTAAAKGFEELAKLYAGLANQSVEQTSAAVKALSSAKTPADFQSVYTNVAKSNLESFVAESRKIQELTSGIVTEAFAPFNARVQALTGLFKAA